ncbi:hypothetical protein SDJN03_27142, partial [Cucurbita argyrosperma subsp. sororia]
MLTLRVIIKDRVGMNLEMSKGLTFSAFMARLGGLEMSKGLAIPNWIGMGLEMFKGLAFPAFRTRLGRVCRCSRGSHSSLLGPSWDEFRDVQRTRALRF